MWKILSSETDDNFYANSVVDRQMKLVKDVWDGELYKDFGLERSLRLFLAVFAFTDVGLYLRNCFQGKGKGMHRKIFVDFYVLLNLIIPCIVLFAGFSSTWAFYLCAYMGVETLCALLSMSFLTPNIPPPVSYRRNLLSLFLNFLQFAFLFAIVYLRYGIVNTNNCSVAPIKALYLSLETFTTVGFGDIVPNNDIGYAVLVIQMTISLIFVYIFFAVFTTRIDNPTYYNKKNKLGL